MRFTLVAMLTLLLTGCSSAPMPDKVVERAQTHLEAGRSYQGAWMAWRAARTGNWKAQRLMTRIYSQSDSIYLDYKNLGWARYWERQLVAAQQEAARAGDVAAMAELGVRYMPGQAMWFNEEPLVEKDRGRATELLKKAAAQGSGQAHAMLAHPHLFERPTTERMELLRKAAELGYAEAHRMMASWMYHPARESEHASVVEYVRALRKGTMAGDGVAGQTLEEFVEGLQRAATDGNAMSTEVLDTLAQAGLQIPS